jgi:hypothetical protein
LQSLFISDSFKGLSIQLHKDTLSLSEIKIIQGIFCEKCRKSERQEECEETFASPTLFLRRILGDMDFFY